METSLPPVFGKEIPLALITPSKALAVVLETVRPLKAASAPLAEALGCCLAQDIRADRDLPPTDRSAMDGFALRARDISKRPRKLPLVGEVAAGQSCKLKLAPGTCVRILTGAVVPPGADTVVKLEETVEDGEWVTFLKPAKAGLNIRRRAEEVSKGRVVLSKGTILGPAQIGLCASVGKAAPRVHARPTVGVLCTGQELRQAGESVRSHQLRDSNGPALQAALKDAGYEGAPHEIVPDDLRTITARLRKALSGHDVVIFTGGVSVGKYDFVPEAIKRIGARIRFHGVAMKPGKPQLYATVSGNRHIFGLPGNPLSVLTGYHELVLPALRRMSGVPAGSCRPCVRLPLAQPVRSKGGRMRFAPARITSGKTGARVTPISSHGSADLVSGAQADGVFTIPAGARDMAAGQLVDFRPWRMWP